MKQTSIFAHSASGVQHSVSFITPLNKGHMHNQNELFFLAGGNMTAYCNNSSVIIQSPAVVIFPSYSIHSGASTDENVYDRYKLFFSDDTVKNSPLRDRADFFRKDTMSVIALSQAQSDLLLSYFDRLGQLNDPSATEYMTVWILYELSFWADFKDQAPKGPTYIHQLLRYLAENHQKHITLEALAERYFISRAKLVADFKKSTHMTVGEFLSLIRLNNAKSLLEQGPSVKAAALACGYHDESYFIGKFAELFGTTPGKYAKRKPDVD